MRVHHLNCGTMRPLGGPVLGCHCLLLEAEGGLVLVDTGFGTADVAHPRRRLSGLLRRIAGVRLDRMDTAVEQVKELGFRPKDVRHIVLTHLDFDHAGGIADFPGATVHVLAAEAAAARRRAGFWARRRYRPVQWRAVARWQEYRPDGEPWFGFEATRPLAGLPVEIALVALPGHSAGHAGVAIRTGEGWLLHAGDALFDQAEFSDHPHRPARLALYRRLLQANGAARRRIRARLRDLAANARAEVRIICAHDLALLRSCQRASERARRAATARARLDEPAGGSP
jgi:glyoxylase-like metal-dependent hydrolase (beta-lactamase superfamily II)